MFFAPLQDMLFPDSASTSKQQLCLKQLLRANIPSSVILLYERSSCFSVIIQT